MLRSSFGELMRALDEQKLTEKTFVFFTSDNGPEGDTGDKGTSVILTGIVESCEAKLSGSQTHAVGAKVKKIYSISKFPTVAPGQLKGDLLSIDGAKEEDLSAKDVEAMLGEIFENRESPMFELRGVRCAFDTRVVDRSAKGKEAITGVKFLQVENKPEDVAARKKDIDARLSKA